MNNYENLKQICEDHEVPVWETYMAGHDGLYMDGCIQINSELQTSAEKACILAEEYGHHLTAVGDITGKDPWAQKQEMQGRRYAYFHLCPIKKIISLVFEKKITTWHELAEELNVTEVFLKEAVNEYIRALGPYIKLRDGIYLSLSPLGIYANI